MGASHWTSLEAPAAPATPHPIVLHIYDLSADPDIVAMNRVLRILGTGVFHCGVEVLLKEWSFRHARVGTGVFWEVPKRCPHAYYYDSVFMGDCLLSEREVYELLQNLALEWQGPRYDVLKRNCCHFSAELCRHLGAGEAFPEWILNLASMGNDLVEGWGAITDEVEKCNRCIRSNVESLTESTQVDSGLFCGAAHGCCTARHGEAASAGNARPAPVPMGGARLRPEDLSPPQAALSIERCVGCGPKPRQMMPCGPPPLRRVWSGKQVWMADEATDFDVRSW